MNRRRALTALLALAGAGAALLSLPGRVLNSPILHGLRTCSGRSQTADRIAADYVEGRTGLLDRWILSDTELDLIEHLRNHDPGDLASGSCIDE
jgi:hypothetical protein